MNPTTGDLSTLLYAESLGYVMVYTRRGTVTHFAYYSGMTGNRLALCHAHPRWPDNWFGTGNQDEIDKAEALPLCARCLERLGGLQESETSLRVEGVQA